MDSNVSKIKFNMVTLLSEQHLDKIDLDLLSGNPNAISILEQNLGKV